MCRQGTEGHGLLVLGSVGSTAGLDYPTCFSNLNHSMIICPKTDKANTWTYFFAKTTNYTDY